MMSYLQQGVMIKLKNIRLFKHCFYYNYNKV